MGHGTKKLHLKRTPAEQAEHDLRKARKAARKAARTAPYATRHQSESDDEYGPQPASSANTYHGDNTDVFARVEEERFREKLAEAMGEDEYVHGLHSRFEAYDAGRVPKRWQGYDAEAESVNPALMEEEEYAEYIRSSMWRKKNAAVLEEQQRMKATQAAAQAEARRKLKAKDDAKAAKRRERALRRVDGARDAYEAAWTKLSHPPTDSQPDMRISDIPWPVFDTVNDAAALTPDALSSFLLPEGVNRKEKLRQTMLRFHPDKFEARVLVRVIEADRERVQECLGAVVQAVGDLMATT
ncbi:unnamed protein product [Peniophora sp. CBMAI 1063]|nr:unnamed protein product [Peniophora sp. CBMAI 1063]